MVSKKLAVLLICFCACTTADAGKGKIDARVAALFASKTVKKSGEEILKGLSTATVEAYRIDGMNLTEAQRKAGKIKRIDWYPITAGPVKVSKKQQSAVLTYLKDPKTYRFDSAKGCKFNPGVALRFKNKGITTDIILCFRCKELRITINDEIADSEDFDGAYQGFVILAKELFPKDKAIQGLK